MSILDCIGNTSLLALRNVVPGNGARVLLKLESENPTGSMKDRMALAMIEAAEGDGRLTANGSVVEYTGGSTGVSLSLVCAVKGYPLHIVTSDAFAREKLSHMKVLGARLQIVHSESGHMTEKLTRDMIEAARIVAAETGSFWTDQMNNRDQLAAYHRMAEEIWTQTDGRSTASSRASAPRRLCSARPKGYAATTERSASWPWNRPSPRSCPVDRPVLTRSTESEPASSSLSGRTASPIESSACPPRRP